MRAGRTWHDAPQMGETPAASAFCVTRRGYHAPVSLSDSHAPWVTEEAEARFDLEALHASWRRFQQAEAEVDRAREQLKAAKIACAAASEQAHREALGQFAALVTPLLGPGVRVRASGGLGRGDWRSLEVEGLHDQQHVQRLLDDVQLALETTNPRDLYCKTFWISAKGVAAIGP